MDAFQQRTCVKFYIENNEENGFSKINYEADPIQFESGTSDEQLDCINFLERAFLYSMAGLSGIMLAACGSSNSSSMPTTLSKKNLDSDHHCQHDS